MVTYVPVVGPTGVGRSGKSFVLRYAGMGGWKGLEVENEVGDVT